jgi:hypothetical protein
MKTPIPENQLVPEKTPPSLEVLLEGMATSASEALLAVQRELGRKDHPAPKHADLCGIELALVEFRSALRNRKR